MFEYEHELMCPHQGCPHCFPHVLEDTSLSSWLLGIESCDASIPVELLVSIGQKTVERH